jgi:predicted DNA-binding antitoxin AbrB/MazE fold protein
MVRSVRAIYENGVFRPLESFEAPPERTAVRLRVEDVASNGAKLCDYAGLWSAEDADQIAGIIKAEFERVDPREW